MILRDFEKDGVSRAVYNFVNLTFHSLAFDLLFNSVNFFDKGAYFKANLDQVQVISSFNL